MSGSRWMTRREALGTTLGLGVVTLAACAQPATRQPSPGAPPAAPQATPEGPQKIVGDVIDFKLEPEGRWKGPFGSVTMKIHKAFFETEEAWFIRTDASDATYAKEQELVFVPLLANALKAPGSFANLYLFSQGASGQAPVITSVPERNGLNFTPAFRIHRVSPVGAPELLRSEQAIKTAEQAGKVKVQQTDIVVNYPLVKWPGGGLAKDPDLAEPLGKGPLVEAADTAGGKVTFKLHQCFPGSRYIVTDTSAVPMAPMMGIVGSGPTQKLSEVKATAPISIFLNGLKGPGVMGFQPAVVNEKAGHPAWSPFWDHFALKWKDPSKAVVVRAQDEIERRVGSGELERFNGLPETHPTGFVVNCPIPVVAPNTYTGA